MTFHSLSKDQETSFMQANGNFKYADIRSKQLIAAEFPYKNEKYSLMIVMPDTVKDMKYLLKNADVNTFNEIAARLEPTDLKVIVPKFRVEFTSKADKALGQVSSEYILDLIIISNSRVIFHILSWVLSQSLRKKLTCGDFPKRPKVSTLMNLSSMLPSKSTKLMVQSTH